MITSSVTVGESLIWSTLHGLFNFKSWQSWNVPSIIILAWQMRNYKAQRDVKWLAQGVSRPVSARVRFQTWTFSIPEDVSFTSACKLLCSARQKSFINVSCRYCYIWTSLILTTSPTVVMVTKESLDEYRWWNCNTVQSTWPYLSLFLLLLVLCYNCRLTGKLPK